MDKMGIFTKATLQTAGVGIEETGFIRIIRLIRLLIGMIWISRGLSRPQTTNGDGARMPTIASVASESSFWALKILSPLGLLILAVLGFRSGAVWGQEIPGLGQNSILHRSNPSWTGERLDKTIPIP